MKNKLNTKKSDMNAVHWLEEVLFDIRSHYSLVITVSGAIACQNANKKNSWDIYFKSNVCRECDIEVVVNNLKNPRIEIANAIANRNKRIAAEKAYKDTPTAKGTLYALIYEEQKKYLKKNFNTESANYGWVAGEINDNEVIVASKSYDKHTDKAIVLETTGVVGDNANMLKHKITYR
jgi:hypothetical protein